MIWIFLLQETLIPEMWKPVFRNTETVLIGLTDIYRVQLICQTQSRFAVRSRLYDWVETDKLVLLQSHTFLGFLMSDSRDMVAGICTYGRLMNFSVKQVHLRRVDWYYPLYGYADCTWRRIYPNLHTNWYHWCSSWCFWFQNRLSDNISKKHEKNFKSDQKEVNITTYFPTKETSQTA